MMERRIRLGCLFRHSLLSHESFFSTSSRWKSLIMILVVLPEQQASWPHKTQRVPKCQLFKKVPFFFSFCTPSLSSRCTCYESQMTKTYMNVCVLALLNKHLLEISWARSNRNHMINTLIFQGISTIHRMQHEIKIS